jgi:hypothetical protein
MVWHSAHWRTNTAAPFVASPLAVPPAGSLTPAPQMKRAKIAAAGHASSLARARWLLFKDPVFKVRLLPLSFADSAGRERTPGAIGSGLPRVYGLAA